MYAPDFSPFLFGPDSLELIVHIGWLDPNNPFPIGSVSETFRMHLDLFCHEPAIDTFGYHICEFCGGAKGSGVILVRGKDTIYAAPEMIAHYVREHQYVPPEAFMRAVEATPLRDGKPPRVEVARKLRPFETANGFLNPKQIISMYKLPTIMLDARWYDDEATTPYNELEENGRWGDSHCQAMVDVLNDPQYNKEQGSTKE